MRELSGSAAVLLAGVLAAVVTALPSAIGRAAASAGVDHLVLSHFMARGLADLEQGLALVRETFGGRVSLAEDLQCIALW